MSKVIIITGTSTGFGEQGAKKLAQKGHTVYATMRAVDGKNKSAAQGLRDFASKESVQLKVLEMDVTSDESVNKAIQQVIAEANRVDVLINNAGSGWGGPMETLQAEQLNQQFDVNITGVFRCIKAVLPQMRKQKQGLLINVSTIAARIAMPGMSAYVASKWGLEGLLESLRLELAPLGIETVIIQPGPFGTNFLENMQNGADESAGADYGHVGEFFAGFVKSFESMVNDPDLPTDPSIVADDFAKLIDMPHGARPLRTVSGLDFGVVRTMNDSAEKHRQSFLKEMELAGMDKVSTN
ncbi:MAG: SDR family oxidoreductase [candidate division Zixibacteria bacterium]|nr:SDR family oxidoreductase [candidate division Zixibacteria bacterium]